MQETTNKVLSNEERDILRKVELMVMHYQDDIETGRIVLREGSGLEEELDKFRNHLLNKLRKDKKGWSSNSSDGSSDNDEKENQLKRKRKTKKVKKRSKK
uniref:CWF21 domain-containing protein n=1 Tax=Photinus pyralis TaxID=7054 RepID=A0A1Y1MVK1_PHOPY